MKIFCRVICDEFVHMLCDSGSIWIEWNLWEGNLQKVEMKHISRIELMEMAFRWYRFLTSSFHFISPYFFFHSELNPEDKRFIRNRFYFHQFFIFLCFVLYSQTLPTSSIQFFSRSFPFFPRFRQLFLFGFSLPAFFFCSDRLLLWSLWFWLSEGNRYPAIKGQDKRIQLLFPWSGRVDLLITRIR